MGSHGYNDLTVGRPITLCQNENELKGGEGRKERRQYTFQVVDKLFGDSRVKEGFWQFKLDSFAPKGLNVRLVDS